jgi:hypothetical protein
VDGTISRTVWDLLLWSALVVVLAGAAFLAIKKIRSDPAQQELTATQLLSKFREMHARGVLSDAEFRTIKTSLAARMEQELNGNEQ